MMMKKIIKWTLVSLLMVAAILAFVISRQPDDFRVERSASIGVPPEAVFPHINNLRQWQAWSPWAKLDSQARETFSGPESGEGAAFTWSGNHEVGQGSMTITESRPPQFLRIRLDFVKPFEGTNTVEFLLEPEGAGTRVTWSMSGKQNFMGKAIGLVMDCDHMIGGMYEKGLAQLKTVAESPAVP